MSAPTATTSRPAPPAPPGSSPPPLGRMVFGVLLILLGLAWLLDAAGLYDLRWQSALSAALLAVGAGLVATARSGAHGGLIALGLVLTAAVIVASITPGVNPFGGAGERSYAPTTIAAVQAEYDLGAGPMSLDFSDLQVPPGEQLDVSASVGLGELVVTVPEGVAVQVVATTGGGEVTLFDREWNGLGLEVDESYPGTESSGRLLLDLSVGLGAIEVTR